MRVFAIPVLHANNKPMAKDNVIFSLFTFPEIKETLRFPKGIVYREI